nr:MAG TPA: hypothetical protein [Caudoviricetes sp.]
MRLWCASAAWSAALPYLTAASGPLSAGRASPARRGLVLLSATRSCPWSAWTRRTSATRVLLGVSWAGSCPASTSHWPGATVRWARLSPARVTRVRW